MELQFSSVHFSLNEIRVQFIVSSESKNTVQSSEKTDWDGDKWQIETTFFETVTDCKIIIEIICILGIYETNPDRSQLSSSSH